MRSQVSRLKSVTSLGGFELESLVEEADGELLVNAHPLSIKRAVVNMVVNAARYADGWFKSGDIEVIDPDGFVRIVDRKKDMIIVSGFNVYPNEIEDVVMAHPKVANCAVIGEIGRAHV